MIPRGRGAAGAVAAGCCLLGSPLAGQAVGTLDIGASVVEYDGFLVSGAAVLAPALSFDAPQFSVGGQGSWTVFESGNTIFQGTAAAAWLSPARDWWRAEVAGSAGFSKYAEADGVGHALARARLHFFAERAGGWVSGTFGGTFGESANVPVELGVGAWTVRDPIAFVGSLAGTWLGDSRHVDLLGAVRWTGGRVEVEGRLVIRPWTESGDAVGEPQPGVHGDLTASVSLSERMTVAVSGGGYPADPVRQVLAAKYVAVGLRLNVFGRERSPVPTLTGALVRAARDLDAAAATGAPRLEVVPSAEPRVLRVYVARAETVELMGDFTDWRPVPLVRAGAGVWEIRLALDPGVHRLNLRIDGGRWLVPAGTRREESEFGGGVGVVVVP